MAKSFAETHPRNLNSTCECEHWQSCIDCHPTAHGEKYITDAMRVRQAVSNAVLQEIKGGSPCPEFWDWLPKAYNFDGNGSFTKYNMEVAFLTGKQSQSQQEPVEYQYRTRPDWIPEWNGWNTCSKESAEAYEKTPYLHDWHYEVRKLYTSPPAQQQEPVAWRPDVCPITGLPFFMWIEHHETGQNVPTYGGPYDSYTIPVRDKDGSYCRERYDHDLGGWWTDEVEDVGIQIVSDQAYVSDDEPPQRTWVGLTDVEWMNIVNKDQAWFGQRPDEVAHEVAKLVEAKLKEKNT